MKRYFLHGLAVHLRFSGRRFSGVDQKDLQLGQEKILRVCSKTWVSAITSLRAPAVSYQAEGKLCHSTIKCYLSAVRQMHVVEGYGDPSMSSMARLEQVLKGIKSLQARTRGRSLRLKASKTDPFRVGINVSVGRTDKALCPVSAVLAYMAVRGPGPGSLFQFQDGRFLTRARLVMRGEGSYLGSGSGQLTVLGAQLPERCSNYSCQTDATIQKLEEQRLPKIQDRSWRVSMLTQSK